MLSKILVIDIETIRYKFSYSELPERIKEQWKKKASRLKNIDKKTPDELFLDRAGIYAEFGKVVAIAIGFYSYQGKDLHFRVKSIVNRDERILLEEFVSIISKFNSENTYLCGHNSKEFDFPYLSRRLLVNAIKLPALFNLSGKKPWEVKHIDTMELWRFGDYKNFTSLDLLASLFNIPSSKSDFDGSHINQIYYEENDLKKISTYCEKDVIVTAQLFLKLKGLHLVREKNIHYLDN